jgi:predicted short-subunit dehydrogenase-like oxidoreductase (DUF2520 family)
LKTVIVGAGRIAWHLGRRLKSKGIPVVQVINRSADTARALGEALGVAWTDDFAAVRPDADWLLIAVRDDAIDEVAALLAPHAPDALAAHTSGATPGTVLAPYFDRYGVFYPLQSFSFERAPLWSKIPFCVDAKREEDVLALKQTAKIIGNLIYRVNDPQRAKLHVAAVFANNFANHCFAIAERLLEENDLPFDLLHPLMEETLAKALQDSPARMQTGPALRGDTDTLRRHLRLLAEHPEWQELYKQLSANINGGLADDLDRG